MQTIMTLVYQFILIRYCGQYKYIKTSILHCLILIRTLWTAQVFNYFTFIQIHTHTHILPWTQSINQNFTFSPRVYYNSTSTIWWCTGWINSDDTSITNPIRHYLSVEVLLQYSSRILQQGVYCVPRNPSHHTYMLPWVALWSLGAPACPVWLRWSSPG